MSLELGFWLGEVSLAIQILSEPSNTAQKKFSASTYGNDAQGRRFALQTASSFEIGTMTKGPKSDKASGN